MKSIFFVLILVIVSNRGFAGLSTFEKTCETQAQSFIAATRDCNLEKVQDRFKLISEHLCAIEKALFKDTKHIFLIVAQGNKIKLNTCHPKIKLPLVSKYARLLAGIVEKFSAQYPNDGLLEMIFAAELICGRTLFMYLGAQLEGMVS